MTKICTYSNSPLPANSAPFQLDMNHRKAVDKHRHVIAVVVSCALGLRYFILIDDLNKVIVDVLFVNQRDIFGGAVVASEHLYEILRRRKTASTLRR